VHPTQALQVVLIPVCKFASQLARSTERRSGGGRDGVPEGYPGQHGAEGMGQGHLVEKAGRSHAP